MTETTEENDIKKRMEIADLICEENRELKSKLSNRDKEIEELKKTADEILYYHEYPDNPRSDIFDVVFDWPTGAHGRVDSYSVITGPSTWCVRTLNSFKNFVNEEDALEYSENLQSKEGGGRIDAGHDLSCHKCVKQIANDRDDLYDEVQKLKAKLSELTHGIPIEKADKEKNYYYETGGAWFQTKFIDGSWIAWNLYRNSYQPITANWLYRFPSQFSQTQEGS